MYKNSLLILIFGMVVSSIAISEEATYQTQAAPEVLKHFINLEGEWTGNHTNHEGEEEQLSLIYRTVSGGTAVEERIFANSPKEMVTIYHGTGNDGILMTHYCMLGNQPRLQLGNTNGKTFDFQFVDGVSIEREKTGHMGGMKMTILDENTFQQEWAYYEDGEVKNISKFTFTRK